MAETDSWEAEDFEPEEPTKKAAGAVSVRDRWEGEDEEEDVKDNWDDEEEAENKPEPPKIEPKVSDKKKLQEKIKEKEKNLKKQQAELKKKLEEAEPEPAELSAEEQLAEKLRLKKLQEDADLELAKEAFGEAGVSGIDAMNPSSREDFTEFGKLLKEKITQYEKSLHYPAFLEALLREVCISLEVDDLKKISNTLTVLCSEKQKQEKQSKAKKKKKGVVPGGGFKANMKDDLADYGGLEEYGREYEDFM